MVVLLHTLHPVMQVMQVDPLRVVPVGQALTQLLLYKIGAAVAQTEQPEEEQVVQLLTQAMQLLEEL